MRWRHSSHVMGDEGALLRSCPGVVLVCLLLAFSSLCVGLFTDHWRFTLHRRHGLWHDCHDYGTTRLRTVCITLVSPRLPGEHCGATSSYRWELRCDTVTTRLPGEHHSLLSSHLSGVNTVNDVIAGWLLATQALITLASCSCLISLLSILVFIFIPVVERRSTATVLTFGCLITGQCCHG